MPPQGKAARFHIAVKGYCWIGLGEGRSVELREGDMVLIPRGVAHRLTDVAERQVKSLDRVVAESGFAGRGALAVGGSADDAVTQLACGHLSFAEGADHPLLRALPDHILIRQDMRAAQPWLDDTINALSREMLYSGAGSAATVNKLAEILFIETVRVAADTTPELRRVMTAIGDRRVSRALAAMHLDPAKHWTLESLAQEAALSRSRFAERFRELVGLAPAAYQTEWRLQKARTLLVETGEGVSEIAVRVGYKSPEAFTRAFGEAFGQAPTDFRNLYRAA